MRPLNGVKPYLASGLSDNKRAVVIVRRAARW